MSGIITEQWERRHEMLLCPTCLLQLVLFDLGLSEVLVLLRDHLYGVAL